MSKTPLLLLGAGGHARACIDVIEQDGRFEVAGMTGLPQEVGTTVLGYPVVGTDHDLPALLRKHKYAIVAVGQIKSADLRMALFSKLVQSGCNLPAIVSPRAHVSRHAALGAGSIVMHGAIVNAGATVGRNCIVNSIALIEHDTVIEDHCHIATAAAVNSGVRVGAETFVGSNACVRQGTRIGKNCVIGMGQRVLADCAAGTWMPPRRPAP